MSANYEEVNAGYDTTFELNEFNEPRIRSDIETIKNVLLFVLFSKPGSYPSIPEIGLDLESYLYTFYDDLNEDDLSTNISEQCSMLGAYIGSGNIIIKKTMYNNKPSLMINVNGIEKYPASYKHDNIGKSGQFLIGITYDDMNKMIYNVNTK